MTRIALLGVLLIGSSRVAAAAEPPDVLCTSETDLVCPAPPVCPPAQPLSPFPTAPPPGVIAPAPPFPPAPPSDVASQQYSPPWLHVAPQQYSPPASTSKFRYLEKTRPRWGMFGAGAGLFLVSWGIPAILGASANYGKLAIPFAGPILLVREPGARDCIDCAPTTLLLPYVILDVLAQATGAVVAVIGLLTTEKVYLFAPPRVTISPTVTSSFAGLTASGRF